MVIMGSIMGIIDRLLLLEVLLRITGADDSLLPRIMVVLLRITGVGHSLLLHTMVVLGVPNEAYLF
jgi:hypothetical protein